MAVQRPLPKGRTEELANWGWLDELRSWTWTGYEGMPLKVRVYTSGDQVKLLLNGKEIGSKPVPESAKLIAQFDVPYAAGELRAIAFKDGQEIASLAFKTVAKPARLRLKVDRQTIRASRGDLAFVTVEITDGRCADPRYCSQNRLPCRWRRRAGCGWKRQPQGCGQFSRAHLQNLSRKVPGHSAPIWTRGDNHAAGEVGWALPASVVVKCSSL